jgi:hypothetical protein
MSSLRQEVSATHESVDPASARQLHELYEQLIDFGAHPNQMGNLTSLKRSQMFSRCKKQPLIPLISLI